VHAEGQKRHTQDGSQLVQLMKSVGRGLKTVRAVDVGCGDGIMAHEMLSLGRATHVTALDLSPSAVTAARQNLSPALANGRAEVWCIDAAKFFRSKTHWDKFDRFVINPPFFVERSGRPNKNLKDQWARHDGKLKLRVWAVGARHLLKTGGELYCVFPTERLTELIVELSRNHIEPKELWWFKSDFRKRRVFLRAIRGAKPGLVIHFDY